MCFFRIPTPKVAPLQTRAMDILPSTNSKEPESVLYGGQDDNPLKRKGKDSLKINPLSNNSGYSPINF